jgi:hypothetical protein
MRDEEFHERVGRVARGEVHDSNPTVLSAAANQILSPYLKARTASGKCGILSMRQIYRRKAREIPLGDMTLGFYAGRYHLHNETSQGD